MYLVDVWGQQANYKDAANVADAQQVRWCPAGAGSRLLVRFVLLPSGTSTVSWCGTMNDSRTAGRDGLSVQPRVACLVSSLQEAFYQEARRRLQPWKDKVRTRSCQTGIDVCSSLLASSHCRCGSLPSLV